MKNNTENIIHLDFSEEMKNSYRDYAMSVIVSRALPDVRDGLKPVQRRILFSMKELGLSPDKPHRKSARIVGDTMGKYHPHGDSSIYDALVHMSEDYSLQIPLVDGHGNFGSIDGDGAAAMRYTEARLSPGAVSMLEHLDKDLVTFVPNFDESEKEPSVLPAMLPILLINGTTGIAVGMATNIPPHNPCEVIDGIIAYINHPNIDTIALMKYIKAPDFPTGGIITNENDILQIYEKGDGKIRIRARYEIENSDNGRKNIVITEIPYTVAGNKTKLVENLSTLMKDKVFDEIYDVRDESSKEGIRVVIEIKKDRDIDNLMNGLYKKTTLEDTYSVNFLAVKEKQPIVFQLKSLIKEFVNFQVSLYTKQYEFLLHKTNQRLEIVKGLMKATDVIDLIIEILRGSTSVKQAKLCLTEGNISNIQFKSEKSKQDATSLHFTLRQAEAILSMQLSKLIGLEILKLHQEKDELINAIEKYNKILNEKKELFKIIKTNLRNYKKIFKQPRRTILANLETTTYIEQVKEEELLVLIDRFGYTKSIDMASSHRLSENALKDYPYQIKVKNTDKLCLFTAEGNMYQIKTSTIPKCKIRDKGTLIQNLCKVGKEDVLLYIPFENLFESILLFTTKNGYIKLVSGIEFETIRSMILATKLQKDDKICGISVITACDSNTGNQKVVLVTEKGLSLGFPLSEVSELKKNSRGIKAIELVKDDFVALSICIPKDTKQYQWDDKLINTKKIRMKKRGAKGQRVQIWQ